MSDAASPPSKHWSETYLGTPWATGGRDRATGLDCWGLLLAVYAEQFGLALPPHTEACAEVRSTAEGLFATEAASGAWRAVAEPAEGDAVAVGRGETFYHVGIYLFDGEPLLLHTQRGAGAHITRIADLRGRGINNFAFYRHVNRL